MASDQKTLMLLKEILEDAEYFKSQIDEQKDLKIKGRNWKSFLDSYCEMYSKLEQPCKAGSRKGWFDKVKNERKNDPLLKYAYQARHSRAHVLEEVIRISPSAVALHPEPGEVIPSIEINGGKMNISLKKGQRVRVENIPARCNLPRVLNKGIWYNPPRNHLGIETGAMSPEKASGLILDYMKKTLSEFENFISP